MSRDGTQPYYFAPWQGGGVYHVYNRAVHNNDLFLDEDDYQYFLKLLRERVTHFAELFAYALIPNHFHLAARLLSEAVLREKLLAARRLKVKERKWLAGECTYGQLIGDYWATAFAMYAQHLNPKANRSGTLLDQTLRRIRIREDLISRSLIMYVHTNEAKHGLRKVVSPRGIHTSLVYYYAQRDDHWLAVDAVRARFGSQAHFDARHAAYIKKYGARILAFDETDYLEAPGRAPLVAPAVDFLDEP